MLLKKFIKIISHLFTFDMGIFLSSRPGRASHSSGPTLIPTDYVPQLFDESLYKNKEKEKGK